MREGLQASPGKQHWVRTSEKTSFVAMQVNKRNLSFLKLRNVKSRHFQACSPQNQPDHWKSNYSCSSTAVIRENLYTLQCFTLSISGFLSYPCILYMNIIQHSVFSFSVYFCNIIYFYNITNLLYKMITVINLSCRCSIT